MRIYAKTDVAIKFYAKNYPYKLIFKSERLKIPEKKILCILRYRPWLNINFLYKKVVVLDK